MSLRQACILFILEHFDKLSPMHVASSSDVVDDGTSYGYSNSLFGFASPPEDTKTLEEKKVGVKGLGRKKTEEPEHLMWKDDIKKFIVED
ncbi:hypothetical protein Bca4012_045818 [Brassica carinata]